MNLNRIVDMVHTHELSAMKRQNAMAREAESMYAVVLKVCRAADRGGVKNQSVVAEVKRIQAAIEGASR